MIKRVFANDTKVWTILSFLETKSRKEVILSDNIKTFERIFRICELFGMVIDEASIPNWCD